MTSQAGTMGRRLVIRADATAGIGMGHVMRCSSLAQAWRRGGGEATFVGRIESDALRDELGGMGFDFVPVETPHPDGGDLKILLARLNDKTRGGADWCVLDGYHFDPDYQKTVRDSGQKLFVVDDHHHLPEYNADILFNQNILAPEIQYRANKDATLLLGSRYALLRRQFQEYQRRVPDTPDKAKKILVFLGGADADNVTLKVIQALNLLGDPQLEIKVVVGHVNPNQAMLEKELGHSLFAWEIIQATREMPQLMDWADFAVCAGGSTCWELAYMGLPALLITVAENQLNIAEGMDRHGAAVNCGWHDTLTPGELAEHILYLATDEVLRASMSKNGKSAVDGKGAQRVVAAMESCR